MIEAIRHAIEALLAISAVIIALYFMSSPQTQHEVRQGLQMKEHYDERGSPR